MVYLYNSNTTLVKVKLLMEVKNESKKDNSNTTLVKVKFLYLFQSMLWKHNSNTTLVKVKCKDILCNICLT